MSRPISSSLVLFAFAASLPAQPARPPVVLVNGYQATCASSPSDSSATFGSMESLLKTDGWQVAFFDNCSVRPRSTGSNRPTIEELGQAFGSFLDRLGAPQVDVVAHSMGGLIVRAYLAGKQSDGSFSPPPVVPVRKAVFIATPNAGLLAIASVFGANNTDSQTVEMFAGSRFLWDLATWNQRTGDLRGVDALSIAGNNGGSTGSPHSHDGVVVLTSASLASALGASRVRVLPYCHADNLPSLLCSGTGIAAVTDRNHPTYRIVTSFLSGTGDWQTIGSDASQDAVLARRGGLLLQALDTAGEPLPGPGTATLMGPAVNPQSGVMPWNSEGVSFADYLETGQYQLRLDAASYSLAVAAGGYAAVQLKPGPRISLVAPAAGNVAKLALAPGMLVAIYGSNLGNASVTIDGVASPVYFNSDSQINTVVPPQSLGLVALSVSTAAGQDRLRILLASSVPALFSADGSGTGLALAYHADLTAVSGSAPAHSGETVSVFLTGLGVPAASPTLQMNGSAANVVQLTPLSGTPGVVRLDFIVPAAQSMAQTAALQAVSGNFASNVVTLYVAP